MSKIHTGTNIIKNKILSSRMSIECLNKQIELSKCYMKMQAISIKIAEEKKKLVNRLLTILEAQLLEFTKERQEDTLHIYNLLNKLDTPTKKQDILRKHISHIEDQLNQLIKNIEYVESRIPSQEVVTVYDIKRTKCKDI